MSDTITVSHHEEVNITVPGRAEPIRTTSTGWRARGSTMGTVYVDAEITYQPHQRAEANKAVERLAAALRQQIADAAETYAEEESQ